MSGPKIVITDYVWDSVDVERNILGANALVVALQTKHEDEFLDAAAYCDALLNRCGLHSPPLAA